MSNRLLFPAAGLALACTMFAAPRPASADPLAIQSGVFGFSGGDPAFLRFIGEDFIFGSILFSGFPDFGPLRTCPYGVGCDPGTLVDFGASYSGPLTNWQTFEPPAGMQMPAPDPNGVLYSVVLMVTGPVVEIPLATSASTTVTAPFTLTGTFTANAITGSYSDYVLGPVLFSTTLSGGGTAQLALNTRNCVQFDCSVGPPYKPGALSYRFEAASDPVPEPATLLLVGGGLAGLVRKRLRAKRAQDA